MEKLIVSPQRVGVIDSVRNNEDRTVEIEIGTAGTYYVMAVGEGDRVSRADFSWIENDVKDTVWSFPALRESYYAGGAPKNRIKIQAVTLQPGKYKLRYKADDSHAFGSWNADAPNVTAFLVLRWYSQTMKDRRNRSRIC
ncbi:MAG: hypothetical protein WDO14_15355 [Bacteroidota bacterium]